MVRPRSTRHRDHHRDGITWEKLPSGKIRARVWDPILRRYRGLTRRDQPQALQAAEELQARFTLGTDNAADCKLDAMWAAYCHERYGVAAAEVATIRTQPGAEHAFAKLNPQPRVNWRTIMAMAKTIEDLRTAGITDFKSRHLRAQLTQFFNRLTPTRSRAANARVAVTTRKRTLSQIRALITFARQLGWMATDPLLGFQSVGAREQHDANREVFALDEIRRLVALMRTDDPLWIHAMLCLYAGLRDAEARAVTWDDYEPERGLLWVRKGKGGKARVVPVQPELAAILRLVHDHYGPGAQHPCLPATPITRSRPGRNLARFDNFLRLLQDAGIERNRGTDPITGMPRRLHRHSLRHTYAAVMLASGEPGDALRISMGHGDADLTLLYASQYACYRRDVSQERWERGVLRFRHSEVRHGSG